MARIWSPSTVSPRRRRRASGRRLRRRRCRGRSRPRDHALQEREVGRTAADVDVLPVRVGADREDLGPESLERLRRDARICAVRAVDGDAEAAEVAPEALDDVLEIAVRGDADAVDLLRARLAGRRVEQRLDLLLGSSVSLRPSASKSLTPLYSGGLCDAEMTAPRSRASSATAGRRQHAGEDGVPARRSDSLGKRLLELRALSRACHARRTRGHVRTRAADARPSLVHEVRGQVLPRRRPERRRCRSSCEPTSAW